MTLIRHLAPTVVGCWAVRATCNHFFSLEFAFRICTRFPPLSHPTTPYQLFVFSFLFFILFSRAPSPEESVNAGPGLRTRWHLVSPPVTHASVILSG